MSQLNTVLEEIVKLYKSGQVDTARRLFKDVEAQYPNYPNVLWVWANISPSKDEQIQSLQLLLQIKPDGKLADSARKMLYKLQPLPPNDVDEFESLPPLAYSQPTHYPSQPTYYPSQPQNYPATPINNYPQPSQYQQPPSPYVPRPPTNPVYPLQTPKRQTQIRPQVKTQKSLLKYRLVLFISLAMILSTALIPLVKGRFLIVYTENTLLGTNRESFITTHTLTLAELWGSEFYLIPSQYIDVVYNRSWDGYSAYLDYRAFIQMANIGLPILLLGYVLPLGIFLILPAKTFRRFRPFLAIWVILHLVFMVIIFHQTVAQLEGGILFYTIGVISLLIIGLVKIPPAPNNNYVPAPQFSPQVSTPIHPLHRQFEYHLKKAGWLRGASTSKGIIYEKNLGVPMIPAIVMIVILSLLGTMMVLFWLALSKKTQCFMRAHYGQIEIEMNGRIYPMLSIRDFQDFLKRLSNNRIGYLQVVLFGVVSMIVNGILLTQLLSR